MVYKQCYLPTISYPLPASSMWPDLIYQSQQAATLWFLLCMGYPCTLPRSIVYSPSMVGGLGFIHLGFEQGIQQVLQLICHLRANTSDGQLYSILISSYQLHVGIGHPILEDTQPLPVHMVGLHLSRTFYIRLTVRFDLSPLGFLFATGLKTGTSWMMSFATFCQSNR